MTHQMFIYATDQERKEVVGGGGYKIKPFLCKVEETKQTGYNPKFGAGFTHIDWVQNSASDVASTGGRIDVLMKPSIKHTWEYKYYFWVENTYYSCHIYSTANGETMGIKSMMSNMGYYQWYYGTQSTSLTIDRLDKTGAYAHLLGNTRGMKIDIRLTPNGTNGLFRRYISNPKTTEFRSTMPTVAFFRAQANYPNVPQQIYYARCYEDGVVKHTWIPAYNCLDVTGFYDITEDRFYPQSGAPLIRGRETPICEWVDYKPQSYNFDFYPSANIDD